MLKRFHGGLLTVAVAMLIAAAPAAAAIQSKVVSDCYAHGQLTGTYTAAQLRQALQTMPPTVKEYTSCYDTIQAALLKQIGKSGGSGGSGGQSGSGGSFLPTPVIVLLVILALAAVAFGALAIRRRAAGPPGAPGGETGV